MDLRALKATPLDDDAFRLLAIPFGGPIGKPGTSRYIPGLERGYDMDKQAFAVDVDIKADWFDFRLVDWHHRYPGGPSSMRNEIVGKAVDLGNADGKSDEPDEDGWWVTWWLAEGAKRRDLVRAMAKAADPATGEPVLYGSSEAGGPTRIRTLKGDIVPWRRDIPGEIVLWPYVRQAVTTSPQNTLSVIRPLKATLDDLALTGDAPAKAFFDDLTTFLDSLGSLPDEAAKSGRVLAARNEARLREAREHLDEAYFDPKRRRAALSALDAVLRELETYINPAT